MRSRLYLLTWPLAAYVSAIVLAAVFWLDASTAFAGDTQVRSKQANSQKTAAARAAINGRRPNHLLGKADEVATLHAIHVALTSVGDGGAYVWRRGNGLLRALIRPTASFKANNGHICRHVIIKLSSGQYTRQSEGIACRDNTGGWSLTD